MTIKEYVSELQRQYATGVAREHTYRPALQQLLATLLPDLTVSNEPSRIDCGAPDYLLQRKADNMPVAYVEAKDIGDNDLGGRKEHKEQFNRYKASLDNIIFTDYLDFCLYENGEFKNSVRIAELKGDKIVPIKENAEKFDSLITHFGNATPQNITSSAKLAQIMAGKARLLANVIEETLNNGGDDGVDNLMRAFQQELISDITPKEFADVYAQTIAYGMFAARLHDDTPGTFSRQEAATLIPKSNPFLRKLFQDIAGFDPNESVAWIIDDLAEAFRATDMRKVMDGFGERTQRTDPMIHFYENFLSAYDPKLRKSRGVYYTPQAVVNFIVRAVDEVLRTDFGLDNGLADTSMTTVKTPNQKTGKRGEAETYERRVHKVQVLDPACGTGTFLAEAVSQIYDKFKGQGGMWQSYVEEHLLPRLNGFELMMAPYTMAHLKLDWLLTQTGYKSNTDKRLRIYLTNSLEEHHKDTGTFWAEALAREARGANQIKRDTPVMVVMGNPPYSVSSSNKGEWIERLVADYKKDLHERNIQPLSDDYIKFIRFGQYYVEKNGSGILAYISNNSFTDGLIHRQMRKSLLDAFDKIYILDLHGNSKKKETAQDGGKDENVFDIMQGVSINIFIKTGKKAENTLAEVYHYDLYAKRQSKYDFLFGNSLHTVQWQRIAFKDSNYFFAPKNFTLAEGYEKGFKIDDLFPLNSTGIVTSKDNVVIWDKPDEVEKMVTDLINLPEEEFRSRYNVGNDSRDWSIARAKADVGKTIDRSKVLPVDYRPFDMKYLYYTAKTNGLVARPRAQVMRHFAAEKNFGLLTCRQQSTFDFQHVFITRFISDKCSISSQTKEATYTFPLYIYPTDTQTNTDKTARKPNFKEEIIKHISEATGVYLEWEKSGSNGKFAPIDLLDYIYAVLHSPTYREKYKEFLKIDFPRVPYPTNAKQFWQLVELGGRLRRLHLLEGVESMDGMAKYPAEGDNVVEKPRFVTNDNIDGVAALFRQAQEPNKMPPHAVGRNDNGQVWINDTQYFDNVPTVAWTFYIGGYQPAQKWLKDRKGRTLGYDEICHYQRIIVALATTAAIMPEIDNVMYP